MKNTEARQAKMIRIGNASGYWGDDPKALQRQVEGGKLDYITMDFLAEITMSIMQKQRSRDPRQGYARDFLRMLKDVLPAVKAKGVRIITNAGGVNPHACAEAIHELASAQGVELKIAVVSGDDIKERISDLSRPSGSIPGCAFANMETGAPFDGVRDRIEAANVYFGALPVVKALAMGPDIIITGRVTDTGITLAPMIHEFGWSLRDWDRLAAGIIAGHLMECGSQVTGGNFTDWRKVPSFDAIGYPVVEMNEDGTFVITKHPGTGGLVSVDSVREQLFYEMGNPKAYITPDVVVDFSSVQLSDLGADRVGVHGVKGFEPTPFYKISMAYTDGYKNIGMIAISGPEARAKAETFAEIFWRRLGQGYDETITEYVGWNACHRSLGHADEGNEVLLRLGARSGDDQRLTEFAKLIPSLILSGPPGVSVVGGVPKPAEVISYWPALIDKRAVAAKVALFHGGRYSNEGSVDEIVTGNFKDPPQVTQAAERASRRLDMLLAEQKAPGTRPLSEICLGRSGDKGDTCNIGILARSAAAYEFLAGFLTAGLVKDWFQELCLGTVTRYELPGLLGFNFMLENALGGGGTLTLRLDAQGKTFAQALLRQKAVIPAAVLESVRKPADWKRAP